MSLHKITYSDTTLALAARPKAGLGYQLLLIVAGSLLVALAAQIEVPMWPVPVTLQTLAVLLVGGVLGSRLGALSLLAYLFEGAIGLPVFAGGGGTLAYFAGPTTGYLIGFVIFGIGGLFRFRMASSSIADTGKLVIVSLIGLATGLDLPVMALIASVAAWIVIWVFGGSEKLKLEVKFDEQAEPQLAMLRLQDHLVQNGFSVSSVSKTKFKPTAQYLLIARKSDDQTRLIREMAEVRSQPGSGVVDWQID